MQPAPPPNRSESCAPPAAARREARACRRSQPPALPRCRRRAPRRRSLRAEPPDIRPAGGRRRARASRRPTRLARLLRAGCTRPRPDPGQRSPRALGGEDELDHLPVALVQVVPVVERVEEPVLKSEDSGRSGSVATWAYTMGFRLLSEMPSPALVITARVERVAGEVQVILVQLREIGRSRPDLHEVRGIHGPRSATVRSSKRRSTSSGTYGSPGPHSSTCSTSLTTGACRSASSVSSRRSADAAERARHRGDRGQGRQRSQTLTLSARMLARVTRKTGEQLGGSERGAADLRSLRMGGVCSQQLLHRAPRIGRLEQREARVRETLERQLRPPGGGRGARARDLMSLHMSGNRRRGRR